MDVCRSKPCFQEGRINERWHVPCSLTVGGVTASPSLTINTSNQRGTRCHLGLKMWVSARRNATGVLGLMVNCAVHCQRGLISMQPVFELNRRFFHELPQQSVNTSPSAPPLSPEVGLSVLKKGLESRGIALVLADLTGSCEPLINSSNCSSVSTPGKFSPLILKMTEEYLTFPQVFSPL